MNLSGSGKATLTRSTFRMEVGVKVPISAPPERIWALLTNARDFPRWNTMVQSIDGDIAAGGQIRLTVPYAPGRVFNLKIREFVPNLRMTWQDGAAPMFTGTRHFVLEARGGGTDFSMSEAYAGLMLPLIAKSLPDLRPSFEVYASDLKKEAEK